MADTPRAVVESFFERMQTDRDSIGEFFADDVVITLPGARFEGPDASTELLSFLGPRYEWAAKEFDRWFTDGNAVVSIGRLYGVDNEGDEFEGVRYIDVYEVEDGNIVRLDIYNDLLVDGVIDR